MESSQRPLVLVVDDVPINRKSLCIIAKTCGYSTCEAGDGAEALEIIRRDHPDLVLLDLHMPEVDGMAVLEELSQSSTDIGVIVVTAESDPEVVQQCRNLGALNYLIKPIDPLRTRVEMENAMRLQYLQRVGLNLSTSLGQAGSDDTSLPGFVAESDRTRQAVQTAVETVGTGIPLIVTGEVGTGKKHLCQVLHKRFNAKGPWITFSADQLADVIEACRTLDASEDTAGSDVSRSVAQIREMLSDCTSATIMVNDVETCATRSLDLLRNFLWAPPPARQLFLTANLDFDALSQSSDAATWHDIFLQSGAACVQLPSLRDRGDEIFSLFDLLLSQVADRHGIPKPAYSGQIVKKLASSPPMANLEGIERMLNDALGTATDDFLTEEAFFVEASAK